MKAQHYVLPWHLENQEGLWMTHTNQGKATYNQTTLLTSGTRHSSCLSLKSSLQLPAIPWNFSNKLLQSLFHGPCSSPFSWVEAPCVPDWCTLFSSPGLWGYVTIRQCPPGLSGAMCLAIPITLEQESLSHQWGEEKTIETKYSFLFNTYVMTEEKQMTIILQQNSKILKLTK